MIRSKVPTKTGSANAALQPVRVPAQNQALHPLAYLKQVRSQQIRWFNSQARTFTSTTSEAQGGARYDHSKFPVSKVGKAIQQQGAAPFASTLRPNLTGGALPRTAGGYSVGGVGKARHFSHTSGCQAQVIHNVSVGIRAFLVGGGRARYDGIDPLTGEKRFRKISSIEEKVYKRSEERKASTRGTNLEFRLSPIVTALSPDLQQHDNHATPTNLQTPDLLTKLSGDFSRSLRSLALISADLNRLTAFGNLPISLVHTWDGPILRVRFSGCDADLVSRLCDEVGVTRGMVKEDDAWKDDKEVQMALLFPFAPSVVTDDDDDAESAAGVEDYFAKNPLEEEARREQLDWRNMLPLSSRSVSSENNGVMSFEEETLRSPVRNFDSRSGYESLEDAYDWTPASPQSAFKSDCRAASESQNYEGFEGIYRFLQVCDELRR